MEDKSHSRNTEDPAASFGGSEHNSGAGAWSFAPSVCLFGRAAIALMYTRRGSIVEAEGAR